MAGAEATDSTAAPRLAGFALEQLEPSEPPPALGTPARLLADAQAEAERLREQARVEGFEDGLRAGREEGIAQAQAGARALDAALVAFSQRSEELIRAAEVDAVELALELAAKIVGGALEVQPERVLDVVTGALRRLSERRQVVVLVDPEDLEFVSQNVAELQARAGGIERCELQADRRVGRGGAIVRTRESEVDAKVATQLERARETVSVQLAAAPGGPPS